MPNELRELRELKIGYTWDGSPQCWRNFISSLNIDADLLTNAEIRTMISNELRNYNAIKYYNHKVTFITTADYTWFILRWS